MSRAIDDLLDVLMAKGHKYGSIADPYANYRAAQRLGVDAVISCLVRLEEKVTRIELMNLPVHGGWGDDDGQRLRAELQDVAGHAIKAMELLDERDRLDEAGPWEASEDAEPNPPGRRGLRSLFGGGS